MLTVEKLRDLLEYDPSTGLFRWRVKRPGINNPAGCLSRGYRKIRIDGELFFGSRLAWLYMTGEWPRKEIDHIDRNPSNDSWLNLREATRSQQLMNTGIRSDNTSGVKGVTFDKERGTWNAQIDANGKHINLGRFGTFAAAIMARKPIDCID